MEYTPSLIIYHHIHIPHCLMDIIWGSMPHFQTDLFFACLSYSWSYPYIIFQQKISPDPIESPCLMLVSSSFPLGNSWNAGRRALRAAVVDHRLTLCEVSLGDRLILFRGSNQQKPWFFLWNVEKMWENDGQIWQKSGNIVINMESIWINMGPCGFLSSTNPISLGHPTLLGSICFVGDPEKRKQNKSNKRTIVSPIRGR